jgi:hypothetical protein
MVHATHFWKVRLGISGDASWFWDVLGIQLSHGYGLLKFVTLHLHGCTINSCLDELEYGHCLMVPNILEAGHIFVKTIHDLFSGTSKLLHRCKASPASPFVMFKPLKVQLFHKL